MQAFNLRVPSLAVGLLGIRNYLLYSVLLIVVPMALQYVRRPRRLVTTVGLVVIVPVLSTLADAAIRVLRDNVEEELQAAMPAHVNRHRTERIATDYLHVLRAARAST